MKSSALKDLLPDRRNLSDTIPKVNLPKFQDKTQKPKTNQQLFKSTAKRIGEAQKQIEIARERGMSIEEILSYDHLLENILFVEDLTAKPNTSELVKELEQILEPSDYNFEIQSHYSTAIMLDFMSQVRKYPTKKLWNFNELFAETSSGIMNMPDIEQIDIIYSYLEDSIKECERIRRRSECEFDKAVTDSSSNGQVLGMWEEQGKFAIASKTVFQNCM